MELHHLKYFVTVAEEASFSKAAQKLFISQSALSQQVSALESEFGVVLLIRGGKKLQLSEPGQVFYTKAKQVLELANELTRQMTEFSLGPRYTDRLTILSSTSDNSLSTIDFTKKFSQWRDEHPRIESSFQHTSNSVALRFLDLDKADLIICNLPYPDMLSDLPYRQQLLCSNELFLIVGKTLYDGDSVEGLCTRLRQLKKPLKMILIPGDTVWNSHIKKHVLAPLGINYQICYISNYLAALDMTRFSDAAMLSFRGPATHDETLRFISTGLSASATHTVAFYKEGNALAADFLNYLNV